MILFKLSAKDLDKNVTVKRGNEIRKKFKAFYDEFQKKKKPSNEKRSGHQQIEEDFYHRIIQDSFKEPQVEE